MTKVVLFDLDLTLLDCNSGRVWMMSEFREGRLTSRDVLWGSWWFFLYRLGKSDLDKPFTEAVATLTGQEESVLRERTHAWFDREVRHRLRPGAAQALQSHREEGSRLVLATSGSIYAAERAAEAYGLQEVICTTMEVRDGRFTGKIASFAMGRHKRDRVQEWTTKHEIALKECRFYTDSYSDLDLLEEVGEPMVVNPDRRLAAEAQRRGWTVLDWGSTEA